MTNDTNAGPVPARFAAFDIARAIGILCVVHIHVVRGIGKAGLDLSGNRFDPRRLVPEAGGPLDALRRLARPRSQFKRVLEAEPELES